MNFSSITTRKLVQTVSLLLNKGRLLKYRKIYHDVKLRENGLWMLTSLGDECLFHCSNRIDERTADQCNVT